MLAGPETEAVLRQQFTITADVKCFDSRRVSLLVNGFGFIVSKEDVMLKRQKLGRVRSHESRRSNAAVEEPGRTFPQTPRKDNEFLDFQLEHA